MTNSIPMLLWCPQCNARHIDVGEFATKIHHTHACQSCGHCWRPAVVPTVGVKFLPGFKNDSEVDPQKDAKSGIEKELEDARDLMSDLLLACLAAAKVSPDPYKPPEWVPMAISQAFQEICDDRDSYKVALSESREIIGCYKHDEMELKTQIDTLKLSQEILNNYTSFFVEKDAWEKGHQWIDQRRTERPEEEGAIGGRFTWCFTNTSLGTVIKVKDCVEDQELDLTDYNSW